MKSGWQLRNLSEVCLIKPPKLEARQKLKNDDFVSFMPMEDLGISEKYALPLQTRRLGEVQGSYTYFREGDVLLAKITPCFENGKLGIAKDLTNGVGFGSSEYIVFRPDASLENEWLFYFLSQSSFREEGAARMMGAVGHKRVSKDFIESYSIPVPPLPEQRRIVAILDEAFAGIATAKANAEKNLQNARALFESYLNAIFTKRSHEYVMTTLDKISSNLDSKRVPITKSDRCCGEYPYYGASGIVDYVSDYIFEGNSLLVSEDGANLLARSTPIAFSVTGKYWVNNHAHILKFDSMATQRFVEFYLESIKLDDYITGTAQPKLNQKALNSIPIPIPKSIETLAKVVKNIELLQEETQRLKSIHQQKLTALDELKKSLLHQAFSGEL
ncbi:MAG TPA: restriction endonuclease subunit S [Candidatus Ozemobacteraceae bacterium]|nr:restriction endonuclease subunit S [Candidatus Ozemobacteraceae bacterium]